MMTGCAAQTGLPECDQRVRLAAPAAHGRPGQGRGDPGAAAPNHDPGTPPGQGPSAVLPGDRAFLAALLHRLPVATLRRLRLLVHPETVLRWHRDVIARHHAARSRPNGPADHEPSARSGYWCCAWHARTPPGGTTASTANSSYSEGRRTAGAAARGRRVTPDQPSPAVGLGRPCRARRVGASIPPTTA